MTKTEILMCAPNYFTVDYQINPWMKENTKVDTDLAMKQWNELKSIVQKYAVVKELTPQAGVPDLVFTANAAVIKDKKAVLARYLHPQRQAEEPYNLEWFEQNGFEAIEPPKDIYFEGAGDALYDRIKGDLWGGYGPRTEKSGLDFLEEVTGVKVHKLELVTKEFYHIDTAFCPLEGGYLIYYPQAFSESAQKEIKEFFPADKILEIQKEEADRFCCNAIDLKEAVVFSYASERMKKQLNDWGFKVHEVNLSEFLKSGGSAKCLSLRITE